ncbi:MAG: DUF1993 domain-containing protein [Paracoccaceae bacterium]|nr:DUF1993 domain-containing protein [Paracoccaceae bacterium]
MYDHIVPPFTRSLKALDAILTKAEAHCTARKIDPAVMLSMRLFPDMLPFTRQILIACDHAKGASARLAGAEVPSFPDTEVTFADLHARIAKTLDFMGGFKAEDYTGAAERTITVKAGPRELSFRAPVYLSSYAVPNFYFHMTTAYAILRSNGVELGKVDFLGG